MDNDVPTKTRVKQLTDSDVGECIICQKDKEENVSTPRRESFVKLISAIDERTKYRDSSYRDLTRRFNGINVENLIVSNTVYHKQCYNEVTNVTKIKRLEARFEKQVADESRIEKQTGKNSSRKLRDSTSHFDDSLCIFCQSVSDGESVHQISTFNRSEQFRKALCNPCNEEVKIRCMTAHDPIAAEIKYHKRCWRKSVDRINESSQKQNEESYPYHYESVLMGLLFAIDNNISSGSVLSMKEIINFYEKLLNENEKSDERLYSTKQKWLKQKIKLRIPNVVVESSIYKNEPSKVFLKDFNSKIVQLALEKTLENEEDELATLCKAAKILRKNILQKRKGSAQQFSATVENTEKEVPNDLTLFLKWVMCGARKLHGKRDSNIDIAAKTVANIIVYNSKSDRQVNYEPKDSHKAIFRSHFINTQAISLGLGIRKGGRSRKLLDLLHRFGFTVSNQECLLWENAIANEIISNMNANDGFFIPFGLRKGVLPIFHLDNSDFAEDSDVTTHALLLSGF